MTLRTRILVCAIVFAAVVNAGWTLNYPSQQWLRFFIYLLVVILGARMKVALPKSDGTMSADFPIIFLGILQLSPLQAVALAAGSVTAQCRVKVVKAFTVIQIIFNLANVATATVLAWHTFVWLRYLHCETAPAMALAATVYFLANSFPVAVVTAWEAGASPFAQWLREYRWYLPFYLVGAGLAVAANMVGQTFGWMTSLLLIPLVYMIYRTYSEQVKTIRDRECHIGETEALYLRTIEGLAMAIEAKDQGTHGHLQRVRIYVSEIARMMKLDKSLIKALVTASYLHDIGKLAVPEAILNKPGKLTPEEFEKVKIHPVVGAEILAQVRFPYPVVPLVRSHHELWDGSGYPDGLEGEEIPIGARILSAVDCFDALASDRPYRKALPVEEVLAYMKSKAGIQFDPAVVKLMVEHYPELEEQTRQLTGAGPNLRTDLRILRGVAPAAGFADASETAETIMPDAGSPDADPRRPDAESSRAAIPKSAAACTETERLALP